MHDPFLEPRITHSDRSQTDRRRLPTVHPFDCRCTIWWLTWSGHADFGVPSDGGRVIRRFAASYRPPGRFSRARAVLSMALSLVVLAAIALVSLPASQGSAAVPGATPAATSQSNAIVAAA